MNDIEQWFCTEPSGHGCANRLIRIPSLPLPYLGSYASPASGSGVREQLRLTTFLHRHEPEHGRFDRLPHREQTVVLEEGSLLVPKAGCDVFAFFLGKDNAVE